MPTGPRPSTQVRTAQASRSEMPATLAGGPAASARAPVAPIGPSTPTPSTSGRLGIGQPLVGRPEPGSLIEVCLRDDFFGRQVRDRPGHAQEPLGAPPAGSFQIGELDDATFSRSRQRAGRSEEAAGETTVQQPRRPIERTGPGRGDPRRHDLRAFRIPATDKRERGNPGHRHPQVDPVAQRTRDPTLVSLRLPSPARAAAVCGAGIATWATVKV
jgi:hypothetical protein